MYEKTLQFENFRHVSVQSVEEIAADIKYLASLISSSQKSCKLKTLQQNY